MRPVNFNGKIIPSDSNIISVHNRSFRYGDGLFESMRCNKNGVSFLNLHAKRLLSGLAALKITVPESFTAKYISNQVSRLYRERRLSGDARVRLMAFRNEGGLYTPSTAGFSFLIEIEATDKPGYSLNETGLQIGIYDEMKKPVNILSNFKTANALLFVMAGIYKSEKSLDECMILNERGEIIEAISCNVFTVKNGKLLTPALESGCVAGVMRQVIIELAKKMNVKVKEGIIEVVDLETADEIFITNASAGIKWVGQLGGNSYINKMGLALSKELNKSVA